MLENEERRPPEEFEATKNLSSDSAERTFSVVITTTHGNTILITTVILRKSGALLNQKIPVTDLQILRAQWSEI